jgi:protein-S-isoprenylcysteine O-methyltransferase Ste14
MDVVMNKVLSFLYGVVCYLAFFVVFLYLIGFVGNLFVPKSIDTGNETAAAQSVLINLALLGLFAIQHTIMARPGFKQWWTKIVPAQVERSTFVLASSLILAFFCWQWQPMLGVIWNVENPTGTTILWALFALGWGTVLFSSFVINHFDLFGLRQVWVHFSNREYHHLEFQARSIYRIIRHPLMLGIIIGSWATPHMTAGHLLFAIAATAYILIGIQFEERDLVRYHGQNYIDYRRRVPMLIPFLKKRS